MRKEQRMIIRLLDYLATRHSQLSFVYGDDEFGHHIIEVSPTEMHDDDNYVNDMLKIKNEFYGKYPDQGLVFISNHPLLKVENPIYQTGAKSGKSFSMRELILSKSFWGNLGRTLGF